MKREKDIKNEVVTKINGYTIVRSESKNYDELTGEYSGKTKVYYDVENEEITIKSFKTLRDAKKYCECN